MRRQHRNRQVNVPTNPKREPQTEREWRKLMMKVIARAEKVGDHRVGKLKEAITQGKVTTMLKRMRIICDNDISRVFPDP